MELTLTNKAIPSSFGTITHVLGSKKILYVLCMCVFKEPFRPFLLLQRARTQIDLASTGGHHHSL